MRRLLPFLLLFPVLVLADTILKDEGARLGPISTIDCRGPGVACSRSGSTGTVTVEETQIPGFRASYTNPSRVRCEYVHAVPTANWASNCSSVTFSGSSVGTGRVSLNGIWAETGRQVTTTTLNSSASSNTNVSWTVAPEVEPAFEGWVMVPDPVRFSYGLAFNFDTQCGANWGAKTIPEYIGARRAAFMSDSTGLYAVADPGNLVAPDTAFTTLIGPSSILTEWTHLRVEMRSGGTQARYYLNGALVATIEVDFRPVVSNRNFMGGWCVGNPASGTTRSASNGPQAFEFY